MQLIITIDIIEYLIKWEKNERNVLPVFIPYLTKCLPRSRCCWLDHVCDSLDGHKDITSGSFNLI